MIQLEQITFAYPGASPLFQDFSLALPQTGSLLVTGPSGCGKTTLLRLIAGLETPQQGKLHGREHLQFAWVFQQPRLLPWATVMQNVTLAGDPAQAKAYLEALGLKDVLEQQPAQLSGGMAMRAAIARALTFGGDLVLLDEAFYGLDAANQGKAAQLLKERFPLVLQVSHQIEAASLFPQTQIMTLPQIK